MAQVTRASETPSIPIISKVNISIASLYSTSTHGPRPPVAHSSGQADSARYEALASFCALRAFLCSIRVTAMPYVNRPKRIPTIPISSSDNICIVSFQRCIRFHSQCTALRSVLEEANRLFWTQEKGLGHPAVGA